MKISYPAGQTPEQQIERIIAALNRINEDNLSGTIDLSGKIVKLPIYTVSGYYKDRGDPSNVDFTLTDLTTDGAWHDLDLSGIVPPKAKTVKLFVVIRDDAVSSYIQFRKNGNTNVFNRTIVRTQVVNEYNDAEITVSCDSNRIIEYQARNTTFTNISITVKGWFY